jgi:hypothetical protein
MCSCGQHHAHDPAWLIFLGCIWGRTVHLLLRLVQVGRGCELYAYSGRLTTNRVEERWLVLESAVPLCLLRPTGLCFGGAWGNAGRMRRRRRAGRRQPVDVKQEAADLGRRGGGGLGEKRPHVAEPTGKKKRFTLLVAPRGRLQGRPYPSPRRALPFLLPPSPPPAGAAGQSPGGAGGGGLFPIRRVLLPGGAGGQAALHGGDPASAAVLAGGTAEAVARLRWLEASWRRRRGGAAQRSGGGLLPMAQIGPCRPIWA